MIGCTIFQAKSHSVQWMGTFHIELIGTDTKLLVLLLCFDENNQSKDIPNVYHINNIKSILVYKVVLCTKLLFIYAFTGVTLLLVSVMLIKNWHLKKFLKGDLVLQARVNAFISPYKNFTGTVNLWNQAMLFTFSNNLTSSFTSLHYENLTKKIVEVKLFIDSECFLPIEASN